MAEFTETVDTNGPPSMLGGCNYVPTYTVKWRNFYDTTLDLTFLDGTGDLIRWVNTLTPTDTTSLFRYEIYSNDPNDIDTTRRIYLMELTATISTSDMNPPYSETQQIRVEINNGCLLDEITNNGNFDDSNKQIMDYNYDPTASKYVYYINEATEENTWVQDGLGTAPWTRQWLTSWSQTVHGCPVEYKIYITKDDGNGNLVDEDISAAVQGSSFYDSVIFYD